MQQIESGKQKLPRTKRPLIRTSNYIKIIGELVTFEITDPEFCFLDHEMSNRVIDWTSELRPIDYERDEHLSFITIIVAIIHVRVYAAR